MAKAGVSRGNILQAAREEFGKHGFTGARVARIAGAAGVNKQLIFYYFGSKAGLHDEVVRHAAATAAAGSGFDAGGGPGPLRTALAHLYDLLESRPEVVTVLVDRGVADGIPTVALTSTVRDLAAPVRQAISEGQGLGHYRDDADPDIVAAQALSLCVGHIALRNAWPQGVRARETWTAAMRDLLSRGLAW